MLNYLLMAGGQQGEGQGNPIIGFLPFIVLIAVFYFFLMRPQMKKQKEHQAMLQNLQRGDRVITTGGIIGSVVGIDEDKIVIKVGTSDGVKLEIAKGFISQKLTGQ